MRLDMNRFAILYTALSLPILAFAQDAPQAIDAAREEQTRLQIFLDQHHFGPGKIDGRKGEFTEKALERYRKAQGIAAPKQQPPAAKTAEGPETLNVQDLDLSAVNPVFIDYTVTKEDTENIGAVPKQPEAQAKLKSIPYESVLEAVAEKFHSDLDFIKELNPGVASDLKEGDTVKVPNVEPFDLAAVKEIKPGAGLDAQHTAEAPAADETKPTEGEESSSAADGVSIRVDVGAKMLEVLKEDKMIAAFPVTPGSDSIPTPKGNWKVKGVARMPDFRRDEKLLKEGVRGDKAHLIPPGPNNPVGVIWIALNKEGIGIHGTNDPDTIGRAASHGCIRLANWDAAKLAKLVKGGVPVVVE
jgi:lipoprotein-anchoring transpeptidase ErfK/SrfK